MYIFTYIQYRSYIHICGYSYTVPWFLLGGAWLSSNLTWSCRLLGFRTEVPPHKRALFPEATRTRRQRICQSGQPSRQSLCPTHLGSHSLWAAMGAGATRSVMHGWPSTIPGIVFRFAGWGIENKHHYGFWKLLLLAPVIIDKACKTRSIHLVDFLLNTLHY